MAVHDRQTATWIWKTTTLCSLQAVLQLLRSFRALPQNSIRVFTAASKEDLNEMLERENTHGLSGSVTAAQFLRERLLHVPGQSAVEDRAAEPEEFSRMSPEKIQNYVIPFSRFLEKRFGNVLIRLFQVNPGIRTKLHDGTQACLISPSALCSGSPLADRSPF